MDRQGVPGTASLAAVVAALLLGVLPAGCDESSGNPQGNCTQLRCQSGSAYCCDPALPGTWDPAAMVCWCPPPGDPDADADGDGDEAADADADGDDTTDSSDPCYPYPCSPYGTRLGNVFRDYVFTPVNDPATTMAGADGEFAFDDLYGQNESHGGTLKALFVFVTAGWCSVCAAEAPKLEALYEELHPLGVEFLGLITDGNASGVPATPAQGAAYAARYDWTFPAVVDSAGNITQNFWPPDAVASGSIGVPLHLFFDLRNMRLYGRFAGGTEMKLPRYFLTEIATAPQWTDTFARDFNFDCAPGTGTETEPNSLGGTPENGTTLPYELSGVLCPPAVGDGILFDEDDIDLGTLAAGTVIDATVTAGTGSEVYPSSTLVRVSGTSVAWSNSGPTMMGTSANGRQWVIDTAGRYYLSVADGRLGAGSFYGTATPPAADQCCEGGPDYTYTVSVTPFTLAATDVAVTAGSTSPPFTLDDGDLNVHPLDVTAGTPVNVRLIAASTDIMDPYLVLWDPATSTMLGFNDDENYTGRNFNSLVTLTPTTTGTIWVVVGYYVAYFRGGPPTYTIQIS
jgi:thiol-disulfide isomerase/thioredoxin